MAAFACGAVSDRGDVRAENQDSVLWLTGTLEGEEAALCLVADGMGGLSYGAQVSGYIAKRFDRFWREDLPEMIRAGRGDEADLRELLEQEIWDINQEILRFRSQARCRCGSTLSLLLLYRGSYYIENMGDSRIYLFRRGRLLKLTQDQSLAAQMEREGKGAYREAGAGNVLTMCLGMFEEPKSYFAGGRLRKGDIFLLCSDGLYRPLSERQMERVLRQRGLTAVERAVGLRSLVGPGKGRDNISALVAQVLRV